MEEIVTFVSQKTGLSPEDSQKAVLAVITALKTKLPAPVGAHLDSILAGGMSGEISEIEGEVGGLLKTKLGGLFGQ